MSNTTWEHNQQNLINEMWPCVGLHSDQSTEMRLNHLDIRCAGNVKSNPFPVETRNTRQINDPYETTSFTSSSLLHFFTSFTLSSSSVCGPANHRAAPLPAWTRSDASLRSPNPCLVKRHRDVAMGCNGFVLWVPNAQALGFPMVSLTSPISGSHKDKP